MKKKQRTKARTGVDKRLRSAADRLRAQHVEAHALPTELRLAQDEIMRLRGVIDELDARWRQRAAGMERAHEVLRVAGHAVIDSLNTLAKRLETRL